MNLSTEQLQAVNHGNGPLLVLAGAGAGKTQTLAVRVAKLIERGARPSSILAVTFTNKAAKELRHRVQAIAGADSESVVMGTFHGLAARHLRPHPRAMGLTENWTILDDDEAKVIVKKLSKALDEDADFALVHNLIQAARDRGLQIDDYLAKANIHGPAADISVAIWGKYHEQLLRINATDFPGLLLGWRKLYALDKDEVAGRYQHVIIDEYQDTNAIQDEIARYLAERHGNIWVVGDFRQSVYSWRSAQIENILTFPKRWPGCKVVLLSGNYRSTPEILNVANRLIKNGEKNSLAIDTDLKAMRPSGPAVRPYVAMDERDEASRVARTIGLMLDRGTAETKDIAVLYRTNAQSRILEQSLSKAGIPYQIVGGFSFWERAEIRDAMAYLRLCFNRNDDLAFGRVVNTPRRGLGGAAMDAIQNASTDHDVSLWAAAERVTLKPAQARAIAGFKGAIDAVDPKKDLAAILTTILGSIEYKKYLDTDEETAADRWNNIEELVSFVNEFPDLPALMEHAALMSGEDRDAPKDGVTLCTIHGAKGREWSVVFCVGWESNILPSPRSDFEEERRLAYVSLTRAKDYLFVGGAKRRRNCEQRPSVFLKEAGLCAEEWNQ